MQTAEEAATAAIDTANHMLQQLVFYARGLQRLCTAAPHPDTAAAEVQVLETHLMRVHGIPTAESVLEVVAVHVVGCCTSEELRGLPGLSDRFALVGEHLPQTLQQPVAQLQQV